MYSYHVLLLPVAVVALVSAHVLLVRRHGVVPPFELDRRRVALAASADRDTEGSREPSTGARS
jgi:quinol-cytochrome oxidoreductase complex cytochrome b subunit